MLGAALGMIFPPLSRATLANISRMEMGNATGIFNLLRNIGGSVGIAISATLLARLAQFYQANLVGHINPFNPVVQSRMESLQQAAIAKGADAVTAHGISLEILSRLVRKEAGMMAYNYIFWILGLAFLLIIPMLLLLRRHKYST
jgi:DHA2 family multidrug resistance protein